MEITKQYHPFHLHTTYSKDAIGTPMEYILEAKKLGMKGITLTDHGSMKGIVDAVSSAKLVDPDFKIIAGVEIYLYIDSSRFHLTLFGDGLIGYNNLCRIINMGNARQLLQGSDGELQYNRVTIDDLVKFNQNVYIATGCPASPFQNEYLPDPKTGKNRKVQVPFIRAKKLVEKLKPYYDGRLFAEGMLTTDNSEGNLQHAKRAIEMSVECNIPLLWSNDIHRPKFNQMTAHQRYINMNMPMYSKQDDGTVIDKATLYKDLYLGRYEDMVAMLYYKDGTAKFDKINMERILQALEFSNVLMDKLEGIKFSGEASLPHIPNASVKFDDIVSNGLSKYISENPHLEDIAKERVLLETSVIKSKDYETYFLLTQEFVNVGKKYGSIGKGRGSAAGSLVSYLMGITDVDPLEYNLLFERFLNPERLSMPDIDIDGSKKARDAIFEYGEMKYKAMPIVTNAYYSPKGLLNDLYKYYGAKISPDDFKALKLIAGDDDFSSDDAIEAILDSQEFANICRAIPEFKDVFTTLLNQIKNEGSHAGGMVIVEEDSDILIPTVVSKDGRLMAGLSEGTHGSDLSEAKAVKFDILGLTTQTAVELMEELTGELPPRLKPKETAPHFDLLNDGSNIAGLFQLSGNAALAVLNRMPVKNILDITAVTSIARTGAKDSGTQDEYIRNVPKVGFPTVKACNKGESQGVLMNLVLDNDEKLVYPENYMILLENNTWKKIGDLNEEDDIFIN